MFPYPHSLLHGTSVGAINKHENVSGLKIPSQEDKRTFVHTVVIIPVSPFLFFFLVTTYTRDNNCCETSEKRNSVQCCSIVQEKKNETQNQTHCRHQVPAQCLTDGLQSTKGVGDTSLLWDYQQPKSTPKANHSLLRRSSETSPSNLSRRIGHDRYGANDSPGDRASQRPVVKGQSRVLAASSRVLVA